jgi:hypothetical protein
MKDLSLFVYTLVFGGYTCQALRLYFQPEVTIR